MSELWSAYWPMILIAVAIGLITGVLIFRPRQRVTLTKDEGPVRAHMMQSQGQPTATLDRSHEVPARGDSDGGGEGEGVVDEVAAATSDVIGQVLGTPVHSHLPGSQGVPDDLQRMKGVGPELAALRNSRGLLRYEQIAALSSDEIERLDAELGAFKGRLTRDRIVEQAGYLARGDQAGYEAAFGKL